MVLPAHGHSTMNGSSTVSSASQASRVKTEPDEWSKEDCLTLLEKIRTILPDSDSMKYKTTESHFDWEKVCFGGFTGDMCKQKWQKVSTEVRKYRTMTELIVDALEYVKNPYKGKKLKTHPEFPKKPLTPYFRFFMEKRAKYAKIHPEMSNLDLTKILSKKYKELPEKKKQKYITEFQSEKESFEKNMARFRENHPELIEERKKSDLPEKPKTPQQLWYNHEKKTYMKLHPDVSQKELKEALRRQWSQLSDKKRLKWISKALELQKDYEGDIRVYHNAHPDVNTEDHVKSVLTKAERQLKDKFDGRPTKPPPNGYSLYCAELMVNMKDVPSTERMVLCSKQWKMMTQKEKDMFQKRCEQKKKQYDVDLQRFLEASWVKRVLQSFLPQGAESLPEEERERVLMEEKLGGSRAANASPHRTKSPSSKERCGEAEAELWAPTTATSKDREHSRKSTLPQSPKSAEKMWQQSVLGDYLLKFRTTEKAIVDAARLCKFKWSTISTRKSFSSGSLMSGRGQSQSDSRKAQSSMEAAWKAMEKKEKISWIKRAAEDQKRYEVQYGSVRELLETRLSLIGNKKNKFTGEPKKPPVSGYQMFSQELLTNGELNHFSLKERMVEIGKRWHKLSQAQKDQYKKLVEEQQTEYKARLEVWVKSLSPQDRAVYREFSTTKRRSTTKPCAPVAKVRVTVRKKVVGVRATATVTGSGKRSMAYRAKQDSSESDDVRTASDSSDSEDEEGSSSSSDSYEDGENDNGGDDDDDDDEDEDAQSADSSSSSEDCSDSDSD